MASSIERSTEKSLQAAVRAYIQETGMHNVEIVEQDAYHTTLPRESFDLVHVRFVLAPVGRDEDLVREGFSTGQVIVVDGGATFV